MRPYVAKSYFQTYKSYDHMQKIRPISQNFNKILTFENWVHFNRVETEKIFDILNPIKPNVFRIVKNPGGGAKRHPLEINKGAP